MSYNLSRPSSNSMPDQHNICHDHVIILNGSVVADLVELRCTFYAVPMFTRQGMMTQGVEGMDREKGQLVF